MTSEGYIFGSDSVMTEWQNGVWNLMKRRLCMTARNHVIPRSTKQWSHPLGL